jgi:hypothetical protein
MDVFNVQPPEWLQKRATFDYEENVRGGEAVAGELGSALAGGVKSAATGNNFFDMFNEARGLANDPMYVPKMEALRAKADLMHQQTADQLQGAKEYPEWLKQTGGDWQKMLDTPFDGTSVSGSQMVEKQKTAAWMTYTKQQAQEIQKQKTENTLEFQRQTEAQKSADLDERKRHNQAVEAEKTTGMDNPQTKEFDDGSKLIHVSPNRWQYVKGGVTKGMSTGQLMALSKSLTDLDPKDTTAATINEALKAEAVQQVKGIKSKPTKAGALPTITTKDDFDALDSGDKYLGKDGQTYQKP